MTPKQYLVECLRALCDSQGGPEAVADQAHVSAEYLKQILNGNKLLSGEARGVGPGVQRKLEAAFPGWAMKALHIPSPDDGSVTLAQHLSLSDVTIPQFDTGGAMGSGVVLRDQPGVIQGWRVDKDWLAKNVRGYTSANNLAIVTGFGDSMRPMFNPGDPLLVDTGVKRVDHDGVYFFRVDDEGYIKRLQRIPGEGLRVLSANRDNYEPWTIRKDMEFEVFGRVLKVWRSEEF